MAGLVSRRQLPPPAGSQVYALTDRGQELEPAVVELARFGLQLLDRPRRGEHYRAAWSPLAMQATFRPEESAGLDESYELRVGDEVFHATVKDGTMHAANGPATAPACVLETDLATFQKLVTGRLADRDRDRLRVSGDPAAWHRCKRVFSVRESTAGER